MSFPAFSWLISLRVSRSAIVSTMRAFASASSGWSRPISANMLPLLRLTDLSFFLAIVLVPVPLGCLKATLDPLQFAPWSSYTRHRFLLEGVQHVNNVAKLGRACRAVRPAARIVAHGDLNHVPQVAFHSLGVWMVLAALDLTQSVARHELDFRRKRGKIVFRGCEELQRSISPSRWLVAEAQESLYHIRSKRASTATHHARGLICQGA